MPGEKYKPTPWAPDRKGDAFPEYPACMLCRDTGLVFGHDQPYRWCKCHAGKTRAAEEEPFDFEELRET